MNAAFLPVVVMQLRVSKCVVFSEMLVFPYEIINSGGFNLSAHGHAPSVNAFCGSSFHHHSGGICGPALCLRPLELDAHRREKGEGGTLGMWLGIKSSGRSWL